MLKRNLEQWAENTWFIRSLETGLWKATKTIQRRRLRNAFEKYTSQIAEVKREEYVMGRVRWFDSVRQKKL